MFWQASVSNGPEGTAIPVRSVVVDGITLDFYAHPGHASRPWVDAEALYDVVGLDPTRRAAFAVRNNLNDPAACNVVRTPGRRVTTLAPDAAVLCVDLARSVGAITIATAASLHAALATQH